MNNAKKIMKDVMEGISELQRETKSRDIESQVQAGAALWAISEHARDALKELKSNLRAIALRELGGDPGTWNQGADDSWAKVVVPSEQLRIRKGADPLGLRDRMTHDEWDAVFEVEEKVSIKKDATLKIANMQSGPGRDLLLDQIETVAGTPRVSLKRED